MGELNLQFGQASVGFGQIMVLGWMGEPIWWKNNSTWATSFDLSWDW